MSAVFPVDCLSSSQSHSACPNCGLGSWSLLANLTLHESSQFTGIIEHCRPLKRNEQLHRAGTALKSLYAIKSGFLRTSISTNDGLEQVVGFSMTGEFLGMDAISTGMHQSDTVALEDSSLCGIRYDDLEELGRAIPALQYYFHRVIGAEIANMHGNLLLLGTMCAEERVATFLLNLSERYSARGYSGTSFRLPMTRRDIGSYLGLKLETVSRVISHFNSLHLISVNVKTIKIENIGKLQQRTGNMGAGYSRSQRTIPGTHGDQVSKL